MLALDLTTKAKKNISSDVHAIIRNMMLETMPRNLISTSCMSATCASLINKPVGD